MRRAENLNEYQKFKSISCPRAMTHRVYCVWPFHPDCLDVAGEVLEDEFVQLDNVTENKLQFKNSTNQQSSSDTLIQELLRNPLRQSAQETSWWRR